MLATVSTGPIIMNTTVEAASEEVVRVGTDH